MTRLLEGKNTLSRCSVKNPETLKLAWRNVLICEFRYKHSKCIFKIKSTQHTNLVNNNSQINPLKYREAGEQGALKRA